MLWKELNKIYTNPIILFAICIFILLNVFSIYRNECIGDGFDTVTYDKYNKVYDSLDGMTAKEAVKYIKEQLEDVESIDYSMYDTYQVVLKEVQKCANYSGYLKKNEKLANIRNTVVIFQNQDDYSQKSSDKTLSILSKFKGRTLTIGPSRGIRLVLENIMTDILGVVLILMACAVIVTREREEGSFTLLKTYSAGREKLMAVKMMAVIIYTVAVCVLLYISNIVAAVKIYGMGNMGRYLQSVYSCRSSGFDGSVKKALFTFVIMKICVYVMIALIILLITVLCRKSRTVYIYFVAVFGIGAVLYYGISENSFLSFVKNINIVAFINTYRLFQSYRNINIFGNPVDYAVIFMIVVFAIGIICGALAIFSFGHIKIVSNEHKQLVWVRKITDAMSDKLGWSTTSLLGQESYKIFWRGKVIVFLVAYVIFAVWFYKPIQSIYISNEDYYYAQYMKKLSGDYSEKKAQWIKKEQKRLNKIEKQYMKKLNNVTSDARYNAIQDKYYNQLEAKNVINIVKKHAKYLKNIKNGGFFYDRGWGLLTGGDYSGQSDIIYGLMAVIMLIISCSAVYSMEYETGMMRVLKTTSKGRIDFKISKISIGVFIVLIITSITYFPWYYRVISVFGWSGSKQAVCSMSHISSLFSEVTVFQYLCIITLMRIVGMILGMLLCVVLSKYTKSYIMTLILAVCLMVLPLLASLCGVDAARYFLLNPFIIGNIL